MLDELLKTIPYSTLFLLFLSMALSLATSLTSKLLTNREQMMAWNKEIAAWRSDSAKAKRTGDKKLLAKVKKQERHIMQLQSKISWQSMKTSFLWFIPFLLLWYMFLGPLYGGVGEVAYLPWMPPNSPLHLPFYLWYLLCSFLSSTLLNKVLGMTPGATE